MYPWFWWFCMMAQGRLIWIICGTCIMSWQCRADLRNALFKFFDKPFISFHPVAHFSDTITDYTFFVTSSCLLFQSSNLFHAIFQLTAQDSSQVSLVCCQSTISPSVPSYRPKNNLCSESFSRWSLQASVHLLHSIGLYSLRLQMFW